MYKGYIVKFSDATYYCEKSENKKSTYIQEATIFPRVENRWLTQAGIKHQDGWNVPMTQIEEASVQTAVLVEIEYEVTNIQLIK